MTVIATGSVDINEATKIAQGASASASDLADKIKNLKTSLDGTITESTSTPFDDGKTHNDGDMWLVMSGSIATAMYIYSNGAWAVKKWDVTSLNVNQLSALTANLGNVNAGTINGVDINGGEIIGATITGGYLRGDTSSDTSVITLYNSQITLKALSGVLHISGGSSFFDSNFTFDNKLSVLGSLVADGEASFNSAATFASTVNLDASMRIDNGGAIYGETLSITNNAVHAKYVSATSQRSKKKDISPVDCRQALNEVVSTPIFNWHFKSEPEHQAMHTGPVINDVDNDARYHTPKSMLNPQENGINLGDTSGILMASIQELAHRVDMLEKENQVLRKKVNIANE